MTEKGSNATSRRGQGELAISQLRSLPEPLFTQVVLYLLGGGEVDDAARLILAHPDCGELRDCDPTTLLRYLRQLRRRVRDWLTFPKIELAPPWLQEVLQTLAKK
jgi:hypothetical protein